MNFAPTQGGKMSTYVIVRNVKEVEELIQRALDAESEGSIYTGMSYEIPRDN